VGTGRGIDGGKSVVVHRPVRAGEVLTGRSQVADIYAKTGRSGTMIFIVHRTDFFNQKGDEVATVDWRMIRATEEGAA
jgi:acyl dehydratase